MEVDQANHDEIDLKKNPLGGMTPSGLRRMMFNMINALAIRGFDLFPLSIADSISDFRELFFTAIEVLYVHAPNDFPRTEEDLTGDELWILKSAAAVFMRYLCYNIEDDEIPEELTL
ncbi:hypothetical protein PRIPAC_93418 [Pristionchus pacificus]|uniref:Uncharacterized protein n=1 Tax=Pristionchus pacificus TaxID=54126 RepID=A0A2A6BBN4_PRIPA|nr:hypothetical protein PRIPAC_93418 [Pristionchus pacificus]|eukprot:PDM63251.1 hypothetical protein PRIPAC_50466 [Pristionchus pacificus]